MAIAHDTAAYAAATNSAAGNYDVAITPGATPNGVVVLVVGNAATDVVTSVAYGIAGGAVTLARRRLQSKATGEAGSVYLYWAGGTEAFPSGTQTVRIARTGTVVLRACVATMTCAAGQQILVDGDNGGVSDSVANPSWSLPTTTSTVCYEGIFSGLTSMTTTPASGWSLLGSPGATDNGAWGDGFAFRTATGGTVTSGWTAGTADDFVGASAAFKEGLPVEQGARQPLVHRRAVIRAAVW